MKMRVPALCTRRSRHAHVEEAARACSRGRHAHGEERHTHTFQEGGGRGGWMDGVGKRMGRQCPSGARTHGCWKSAMQVLLTRGTRDASARPRAPGTRLRASNHASRKIGAKTAFARICSDAGAQRLRRASRESPSRSRGGTHHGAATCCSEQCLNHHRGVSVAWAAMGRRTGGGRRGRTRRGRRARMARGRKHRTKI